MKKLLTILCSLVVALAFVSVTSAADPKGTKVQNIPPNSKQGNPAPKQLNTKATDTKATAEEQKGEKKETKDAKKKKKVEKKEEEKKADEKK